MTSPRQLADSFEDESSFNLADLASSFPEASSSTATAARTQLVNRTHRIVRERAQAIQSQRSRGRSLWIPMAICAAFLLILCTAIWSLLDQYEMTPTGIPDASSQIFIFLVWFLPVTAAILALAWARRAHSENESVE